MTGQPLTDPEADQFERAIDDALAADRLASAADLAARYLVRAAGRNGSLRPAWDPWVRGHYLAAQAELARGRLGEALAHLEQVLTEWAALPDELAARADLLAAEACVRLGRKEGGRAHLDRVPERLLQGLAVLRLRAVRTLLLLRPVGTLGREIAACQLALSGADQAANRALLLCDEGKAWYREGDLGRAGERWDEAERRWRPAPADAIRADVRLQLGRLAHVRGHLALACQHYDAAASAEPFAEEVAWRRLLVRLDLGQGEAVRAAVGERLAAGGLDRLPEEVRPLARLVTALAGGEPPGDASDETLAYLAGQRGDLETATRLYAAALKAASSAERRARLVLAQALLAVDRRQPQEAVPYLAQAEGLARSLDLPEVLARALLVEGQLAAEQEGGEAEARRYFEEAVLVTETQAGLFRNALDRAAFRWQRGSVLRRLLLAACRRGDASAVFGYQEQERGRLLLDLLASAKAGAHCLGVGGQGPLAELQSRLEEGEAALDRAEREYAPLADRRRLVQERERMLLARDQLFEAALHERGAAGPALPVIPTLPQLQHCLPRDAVYLAPVLEGDQLFLLAVRRSGEPRVWRGGGGRLRERLGAWKGCLQTQIARYECGLLGRHDRAEMDQALEELGQGPLGDLVEQALAAGRTPPSRVVWAPDGLLHGFPLHALRRGGRYLVERHEVSYANSGSLLVHQARRRWRCRSRLRPALVVAQHASGQEGLPSAEGEANGVAASFLRSQRFTGAAADRATVRHWLRRAQAAHFACHAAFDARQPLASSVLLPSGERISALDWLDEPVDGLRLVVLSACRSAEVGLLTGHEVFGLVTGLLGGGVRAVVAGLWPVGDEETVPLMWSFYRHRLEHDLATALALAQRDALRGPAASPFFWAAFCLHGDPLALPPARGPFRWLARWRSRRHASRFPGASGAAPPAAPPAGSC